MQSIENFPEKFIAELTTRKLESNKLIWSSIIKWNWLWKTCLQLWGDLHFSGLVATSNCSLAERMQAKTVHINGPDIRIIRTWPYPDLASHSKTLNIYTLTSQPYQIKHQLDLTVNTYLNGRCHSFMAYQWWMFCWFTIIFRAYLDDIPNH